MIPTLYFAIGFVVYVAFIVATFKSYSLKREMTKGFYLVIFYVFYTFLAWYVINLVDGESGQFAVLVQTGIYALLGGMFSYQYYNDNIKSIDDKMYGQNV